MTIRLTTICIFLATILLIVPSQSFARIDIANCGGAWIFNEEGEDIIEDISGNGNNGIVMGGAQYDEGPFGSAMYFDGQDDLVNCGAEPSLNIEDDDFSLVAWMRCEEYAVDGWAGCVISRFNSDAPRHGYLFGIRGGLDANQHDKPLFLIGLGQSGGHHLFGTSTINDGEWHHIAAVADRDGKARIYRDGVLEAESNISGDAKQNEDNAQNVNIGGDFDSRWRLNATIDEVALFKTALTEEDVNRIMNFGLERVFGITAVSRTGKLASTWASIKSIVR